MASINNPQSLFRRGDVITIQVNPDVAPFEDYDGHGIYKFLGRVVGVDRNGLMVSSEGHTSWDEYVKYDQGQRTPLTFEMTTAQFYPWHQIDSVAISMKLDDYMAWVDEEVQAVSN